jgi:hypothetical protein
MLKMLIGLLAGVLIAVVVTNATSTSFLDLGLAQTPPACNDDIADDEDDPNEIDDLDDADDCDGDDDDDTDDSDDDRGEQDDEDDPNEVDDD